jgi:uncharacterized repeat protein (TIGR02543 family)
MPYNGMRYTEGQSVTISGQGGLYSAGRTFVGWNSAADASGDSYAAGNVLNFPAHDVDLYAQWTDGSTFSIIYLSPQKTGGTVPSDANSYAAGSAAVIKPAGDLARTGFVFGGWTVSADGDGTVYSPDQRITMANSDLVLYARWLPGDTPLYSVTYARGAGAAGTPPIDSNLYAAGMTVTVKGNSDLTRTDYRFSGWTCNAASYEPGDTLPVGSSNITLTAAWSYSPTYHVTYDANGGTGTVPEDLNAYDGGASVTLLSPDGLSNGGLAFGGWYENQACTGTRYAAGAAYTISGDQTFYASWVAQRHISYSANGGAGAAPVDAAAHASGEIVQLSGQGSLSLADSDFNGWNTQADGTGIHYVAGGSIVMKDADLALHAEWRPRRYRYAATGAGGFKIFDMADPARPRIIGSYLYQPSGTPVSVNAVAVRGNRAYLATDSCLLVLDISTMANPSLMRTVNVTGIATDVALSGGYAYVTRKVDSTEDGGLSVVDLASSSSSAVRNITSMVNALEIAVNGDCAYVIYGHGSGSSLRVFDISVPASAAELASAGRSFSGYARGLCLRGGVAYLAAGGLVTIDLGNPRNPGTPAILALGSGSAYDVDARDGYAFVAADSGDVLAYSLASPLAPAYSGAYADADMANAQSILRCGDLLYVTDPAKGLFVLDAANPLAMTRETWSPSKPNLINTAIYGNYLYACESILTQAIDIYDISSPPNISCIGRIATSDSPYALDVAGDSLYVAMGGPGVAVYSLADPAAPLLTKTINTYIAEDVKVRAGFAYVADYSSGFSVIDLSDDSVRSIASLGGDAEQLALSGNYAYVGVGSRLRVVDISTPRSPVLLPNFDSATYPINEVKVVGSYAYVGTQSGSYLGTVETFSIAVPANIANVDYDSIGPVYGLGANGSTIYASTDDEWISFTLAAPANPAEGGSAATPSHFGSRSSFAGDYAFIPGWNGIMAMDLSAPLSPSLAFQAGNFINIR